MWKQWRHHLFTLHILGKPLVSCSTRLIRTCTHINIHTICNLKVQHAHMYLISVKGRLLRCKKNNICSMQRKGLSAFFFQTLFLATLRTTWQGGCYCQGSVHFSPSHDYQIGYTWVVGQIAIKWGIFFCFKGQGFKLKSYTFVSPPIISIHFHISLFTTLPLLSQVPCELFWLKSVTVQSVIWLNLSNISYRYKLRLSKCYTWVCDIEVALGCSDQHMPRSLTFTMTCCVCCSLQHYIAPHVAVQVYAVNFWCGEPIADWLF